MPFFPPRRPTDPEDVSDLFSEFLSNEYGEWVNGRPDWMNNPILNASQAAVPVYCLKQTTISPLPWGEPTGCMVFFFNQPLDMSNWEEMRIFVTGFGESLDPVVPFWVTLRDINGNLTETTSHFNPTLDWQPKMLFLTGFVDSISNDAPFDWEHVTEWHFTCRGIDAGEYFEWYLDAGPFLYRAAVAHVTTFEARQNGDSVGRDITVVNNDTGETFTIPSGNSASLIQENGTSYTITAPATYFIYWEDGNTNPERIYTPTEAKTLTAYYAYPAVYALTINSEPTEGHHGDLEGFPFVTNITFPGLSSGNYEITIQDTANFIKWEDESTNPTRVISLISDMTVTAFFTNGNGNGNGGAIPPQYALLAVFGVSSAALAYYLWKIA